MYKSIITPSPKITENTMFETIQGVFVFFPLFFDRGM